MQLPSNLTQRQIIIVAVVALVVIGGLFLVIFNFRSSNTGTATAANLTIWGTDPASAMNALIASYNGPGSGTNSQIRYVQITPANYKSEVLSALAAGTGPDIFEISNRDLSQWQNVLAPLPAAYAQYFNLTTLQNDFPTIVGQDFVSGGNIYALPLSIDTLAMIYNKDLLDAGGVATIPRTWSDLYTDIPKLRTVNAAGQLTQAAVALGGSETSIPNASDLVFLLMLQNGTQMTGSDGSSVAFANSADSAGLNAFSFYLQFANAASPYYTWNDGMGNAEDSFAQGKTAIIFGYASDLANIKAKAPFLNFAVAPMPQPANLTVNYARYNGLAVNKNSPNAAGAWSFIINLTTSQADENIYTGAAGTPPALRTAIAADATDPAIGVFTSQVLTARSWHETNAALDDSAIDSAIKDVLSGAADSQTALSEAQSQINGQ